MGRKIQPLKFLSNEFLTNTSAVGFGSSEFGGLRGFGVRGLGPNQGFEVQGVGGFWGLGLGVWRTWV